MAGEADVAAKRGLTRAGRVTQTGRADTYWSRGFRWRDGERLVRFGRGAADEALGLLERERLMPFALITTSRAAAAVPRLAAAAQAVVHVPPGPVPEAASAAETAWLEQPGPAAVLLAVGGGRVIDTCKAAAAAHELPCAAVPTTLSGAEMSAFHRPLHDGRGAAPNRPRLVVADPALSASLPPADLAASAMNAFGHAMEALYVRGAGPVTSLAAVEAAHLLTQGMEGMCAPGGGQAGDGRAGDQAARDLLALGGLLAGYAIALTGLGLHHAVCQTIVRTTGAPHARVNAVMAPHVLRRMLDAAPAEPLAPLVGALVGEPDAEAALELVTRLAACSGVSRLGQLGVSEPQLPAIARAAAARPELRATPSAPDEGGVLALLRAAL